MDDTQLIELAYKAFMNGANLWEDKDMAKRWNPLESDSDALRLAVKLQMHVNVYPTKTSVTADGVYLERLHDIDSTKATRRAITRAAAEIGKAMK